MFCFAPCIMWSSLFVGFSFCIWDWIFHLWLGAAGRSARHSVLCEGELRSGDKSDAAKWIKVNISTEIEVKTHYLCTQDEEFEARPRLDIIQPLPESCEEISSDALTVRCFKENECRDYRLGEPIKTAPRQMSCCLLLQFDYIMHRLSNVSCNVLHTKP